MTYTNLNFFRPCTFDFVEFRPPNSRAGWLRAVYQSELDSTRILECLKFRKAIIVLLKSLDAITIKLKDTKTSIVLLHENR